MLAAVCSQNKQGLEMESSLKGEAGSRRPGQLGKGTYASSHARWSDVKGWLTPHLLQGSPPRGPQPGLLSVRFHHPHCHFPVTTHPEPSL